MKTQDPINRRSLLDTAFSLGCLIAATVPVVHAAPVYWDGTTAGWDVAANWSTDPNNPTPDPGAVPTGTDDVYFNISSVNGAETISLNAVQAANSLNFNNTGTTFLQANTVVSANRVLNLGGGGINVAATAGAVTIGTLTANQKVNLNLTASQTWTNNSATPLTIGSVFTSAAGVDLTIAGTVAMTDTANTSNLTGTLNMSAGSLFRMSGDVTTGGLIGSGTVENGGAAAKWMFVNNAADNNFSGNLQGGAGVARLGFVKRGAGTTTWSGTNVLGDRLAVENGTLKITGTTTGGFAAGGANNAIYGGTIANQNGRILVEGGTLNGVRTGAPSIGLGALANAQGFLRMTSGAINSTGELHVGRGLNAYAAFSQSSGATTVGSWLVVGFNNDRAVLNQNGGSIAVTANRMTIGAGGTGSNAVVNLSGGSFSATNGANGGILVGERGLGVLNVSGTAAVSAAFDGITFGPSTGAQTGWNGTLNLLGGNITTNKVAKGLGTGTATFNFNGGTLTASTANATFMGGLNNAFVHSGGGTIDNAGNAIGIGQSLLAPTGNGVSSTGLSASGSGYLDTPLVIITGGGGTGATAVATIDGSGNLTGIVMTNPGTGYTSAPTFSLAAGGGFGNTGAISGTASLVSNVGGGLIFTGSSTTTLTGTNTYTGTTAINNGTVRVNGSHTGGSGYSVAAPATLGGTGSITSTISVTGTLAPGASVESFASGTVNFLNGSTFATEQDSTVSLTAGSDLQAISGDLNLTGTVTLTLNDLATGGPAVAFTPGTIFSLISYTGTWNNGLFTFGGNLLADGDTFTAGLNTWEIDYDAATGGVNFTGDHLAGDFVNITAIPEPEAALLGGLGVLLLVGRRHRGRVGLAR